MSLNETPETPETSRDIRDAFFQALKESNLTAKEICEASGITGSMVSRFRRNRTLRVDSFQRLLNVLPKEAFLRFVEILQGSQEAAKPLNKSNNELVLELRQLARQYARNRERERNNERAHSIGKRESN